MASAPLQVNPPSLPHADGKPGKLPTFESAEHETIGNKVILTYSGKTVAGTNFDYKVSGQTLSYGKVVALAGDYYGNYSIFHDAEQISDKWDSHRQSSLDLAKSNAHLLSSDKTGWLKSLVDNMEEEATDVKNGMKAGKDPAQIYESITSHYNLKYALCTGTAYIWVSLCNWDHFGTDAIKAYSALHTLALQQAAEAHKQNDDSLLTQAYFYEAFGSHFLTDLFSSGHMRTPRRVLHNPISPLSVPEWLLFPADTLAEAMHDEDCANGLWVSNKLGESWAAYGDKQLWNGQDALNFRQAVRAAQAGADEVWKARNDGIVPFYPDFQALKIIPEVTQLNTPSNYAPLFSWKSVTSDSFFFRKDVNNRADYRVDTYSTNPGVITWEELKYKVTNSRENKDMYPFTKAFLSPTNVFHLRGGSTNSSIILNSYGVVDSTPYGVYWSMKSQSVLDLSNAPGAAQWTSVTSIGEGVLSLVGRFTPQGALESVAAHIGLRTSADGNASPVWSSDVADGNSSWTEGDIVYGGYGTDSNDIGMIKHWYNGPSGASKLEVWSLPATLDKAPTQAQFAWPTNSIDFLFSYQIQLTDQFSTFVACGYNRVTSNTSWHFATWSSGYGKPNITEFTEGLEYPAQSIISGKRGSDGSSRIIRLFYGSKHSMNETNESNESHDQKGHKDQIQIDVLKPTRDPATGKINPDFGTQTQTFPITWPAVKPQCYLTWFLADVDGNGILDLVTFVVDQHPKKDSSRLNVVVFPGQAQSDVNSATPGAFGTPVVTNIQFNNTEGTLFDASFIKSIKASQATYTYVNPNDSKSNPPSTNAAILSLFDNYGVVGARILAPVSAKGTFKYEMKGQSPAIAGQPSVGLATNKTGQSNIGLGYVFN